MLTHGNFIFLMVLALIFGIGAIVIGIAAARGPAMPQRIVRLDCGKHYRFTRESFPDRDCEACRAAEPNFYDFAKRGSIDFGTGTIVPVEQAPTEIPEALLDPHIERTREGAPQ